MDDLVDGLVKLMHSDCQDPINIGNPQENTIIDLAKLIIELTDSSSDIEFESRARPCSKTTQSLAINPEHGNRNKITKRNFLIYLVHSSLTVPANSKIP